MPVWVNVVVALDGELIVCVSPLSFAHEYVYGDVPPDGVQVVEDVVAKDKLYGAYFSSDVGEADAVMDV